ncbi:death-inducer obliterator 1-like [Mercenaria mercenaria]|uniref:death-inducer obliterator 1-like n=1 Tax=Mercenaria mercenaria TaxID=6596 RepID=UPI00234EB145|nr:death-inducer obliterator 1-like [Mercenaria mercenaria]XP_053392119.1 death-inducer obliterator 1-like [Mercenaria mercenaria]
MLGWTPDMIKQERERIALRILKFGMVPETTPVDSDHVSDYSDVQITNDEQIQTPIVIHSKKRKENMKRKPTEKGENMKGKHTEKDKNMEGKCTEMDENMEGKCTENGDNVKGKHTEKGENMEGKCTEMGENVDRECTEMCENMDEKCKEEGQNMDGKCTEKGENKPAEKRLGNKKVKLRNIRSHERKSFVYPKLKRATRTYCVCQKPDDGRKYWQCDTCSEWFHPECLNVTEETEDFYCNNCSNKPTDEDAKLKAKSEGKNNDNKEILDSNDDRDVEIVKEEKDWCKNYNKILHELKDTVICDNRQCDNLEHLRHHKFCKDTENFIQTSQKQHHFGRDFFTIEHEQWLYMKMAKDLLCTKRDPSFPVTGLPITTLNIVKENSRLDRVLKDFKLVGTKYIMYVLVKDYMVLSVSFEKNWPLEKSENECLKTEVNLSDIIKRNKKHRC